MKIENLVKISKGTKKEFNCEDCSDSFETKKKRKRHMRVAHMWPFKGKNESCMKKMGECNPCREGFIDEDNFRKEFNCEDCSDSFETKKKRKPHMRVAHMWPFKGKNESCMEKKSAICVEKDLQTRTTSGST